MVLEKQYLLLPKKNEVPNVSACVCRVITARTPRALPHSRNSRAVSRRRPCPLGHWSPSRRALESVRAVRVAARPCQGQAAAAAPSLDVAPSASPLRPARPVPADAPSSNPPPLRPWASVRVAARSRPTRRCPIRYRSVPGRGAGRVVHVAARPRPPRRTACRAARPRWMVHRVGPEEGTLGGDAPLGCGLTQVETAP